MQVLGQPLRHDEAGCPLGAWGVPRTVRIHSHSVLALPSSFPRHILFEFSKA